MTTTKTKRACIKRGPKKYNREQERANAAKLKLKVLAMLQDCSHSVKEMAEALECKPSTLRDYLFRMSNEGLVSSVLEKGYGGGAVFSGLQPWREEPERM